MKKFSEWLLEATQEVVRVVGIQRDQDSDLVMKFVPVGPDGQPVGQPKISSPLVNIRQAKDAQGFVRDDTSVGIILTTASGSEYRTLLPVQMVSQLAQMIKIQSGKLSQNDLDAGNVYARSMEKQQAVAQNKIAEPRRRSAKIDIPGRDFPG